MFGLLTMKQIRVMITDGDAQEIQQLDNAINLFLPHVLRVRCGWHLVHQGLNIHVISYGKAT